MVYFKTWIIIFTGSIITKADLQKYFAKEKKPITFKLNNNDTYNSLPPPSSGVIVGFILKVIEGEAESR